jgi:hypothetical protein
MAGRDEIGMPGAVGTAARGLITALAPLGRARGYRPRYPRYSLPDAP